MLPNLFVNQSVFSILSLIGSGSVVTNQHNDSYYGNTSVPTFNYPISNFLKRGNYRIGRYLPNFNTSGSICGLAGNFHKSPLFHDQTRMLNFLQEIRQITTAARCLSNTVTALLDPINLDFWKHECDCDCPFAHGANGDRSVCVYNILPVLSKHSKVTRNEPIPCTCTYLPEDLEVIACERPPVSSTIIQEVVEINENGDLLPTCLPAGPAEAAMCNSKLCRPAFDAIISFSCAVVKLENGLDHYVIDGYKIYPQDICALDCFLFHGSIRPPYGECVFNSLTGIEFCFCYL